MVLQIAFKKILIIAMVFMASAAKAGESRPNVIIIMADDLGYSDIGSYGSEIETPNIDAIAAEGVKFSQFYNTSRCSPSRASLLTGRYPHKVQMGHLAGKAFESIDGYRGDLDQSVQVLPEVLSANGYKNYMVGKWHLGNHSPADLQVDDLSAYENTPLRRGFDAFYGTMLGGNNYFSPKYLFRNNQAESAKTNNYYYTDAISREAVSFIEAHSQKNQAQPFFLYVAYTAPHWPIQAPKATIAKYRKHYQGGWDSVRQQRYERLLALGLIDKGSLLSERDELAPAWDNTENKAWQLEHMAVHAAMIDHLDQGVGQLLVALDSRGLRENTLIIFLSDNGGSAEDIPDIDNASPQFKAMAEKILGKYKPSSGETMSLGNALSVMPGSKLALQTIGPAWANVSNTPFRKYKSRLYEGGIASPLIISWPKEMNVKAPQLRHEPAHIVDVFATVMAASSVPKGTWQNKINPIDGESLLPVLAGKKLQQRSLFFEHEGDRAIRLGKWKLISPKGAAWELYNLKHDRTELNNLANIHTRRVKRMIKQYEQYARNSKVKPWAEVSPPKSKQ